MKNRLVCLLFLFIAGCSNDKKDDLMGSYPGFDIKYEIGSGWTGQNYRVYIQSPDKMTITFNNPNQDFVYHGSYYYLEQNEVDTLIHCLNEIKNIPLHNYGFGPDKPTDLPVTSLKYDFYGFKDSAAIYAPVKDEVPVQLSNLIQKIKNMANRHDTVNFVIN
jgi:hypothetical protein